MTSAYEKAKSSGYSDEELMDYLSKKDINFKNKFEEALNSGYSPKEVFNHAIEGYQKEAESRPRKRHAEEYKAKVASIPGIKEITATAKGLVQDVAGTPGTIESLLRSFSKSKIGEKISTDFFEKHPNQIFPLPEDVKKFIEKKAPWTKPDTILRDFFEGVAPTFANLLSSGMGWMKSLGVALAGQTAKSATKALDLPESTQLKTKIGVETVMSLIDLKGALKYISSIEKAAQDSIPQGARISVQNTLNKFSKLEQQLAKGAATPQKSEILDIIKSFKKQATAGTMEVSNLREFERSVNQLRSNRKLFELPGEKRVTGSTRLLNSLQNDIKEATNEYGKINPMWLKTARQADEAYASFHQSQRLSRWIQKHASKTVVPLAAELFMHPVAALKTGGASVAALGALKGGELIYRISKSSELRKYYIKTLINAAKGNSVEMNKNLIHLQRKLEEGK